jgi:deoxyribonuclease V
MQRPPFCAIDVHYGPEGEPARAACVLLDDWSSAAPRAEQVVLVHDIAPYVPGEFFRRELPPVLRVLGSLPALPSIVLVDGYVWLDPNGRRGLGAHLHEALEGAAAVVGVAKTAFRGETGAVALLRGESARPLFVSAVGISIDDAVAGVRAMHGAHRLPTLLQRVDHLARGIG